MSDELNLFLNEVAEPNLGRLSARAKTLLESSRPAVDESSPLWPPLNAAMRGVLTNEGCVYGSEDEIYRALAEAAGRVAAVDESAKPNMKEGRWCPDECPITGRPFSLWMSHPDLGYVPTYGGPFDSYTIAEPDEDGYYRAERYDHDEGAWVEGGEPVHVRDELTVTAEIESEPATVATKEAMTLNQCDGCRTASPISNQGNHVMPDGGFMGCTADRYVASSREAVTMSDEARDAARYRRMRSIYRESGRIDAARESDAAYDARIDDAIAQRDASKAEGE